MSEFSNEAKKTGLEPKAVNEMTTKELKEFLASVDPDAMGYDGPEGIDEEEQVQEETKDGE